jgi:hypothetical protein
MHDNQHGWISGVKRTNKFSSGKWGEAKEHKAENEARTQGSGGQGSKEVEEAKELKEKAETRDHVRLARF